MGRTIDDNKPRNDQEDAEDGAGTLDRFFLARIGRRAEELIAIPQEELMRVGGTEATELSIWFAMRGALSAEPREVYTYYTFPKFTGCGVIAFEETRRS